METKMIYSKPTLDVVVLRLQQHLLAGSGGGDIDDLSRQNDMIGED